MNLKILILTWDHQGKMIINFHIIKTKIMIQDIIDLLISQMSSLIKILM